MIKPTAAAKYTAEIKKIILDNKFTIVAENRHTLTVEQAKGFYGEHAGKPFFDGLIEYMTSGPIVAMVLAKVNY